MVITAAKVSNCALGRQSASSSDRACASPVHGWMMPHNEIVTASPRGCHETLRAKKIDTRIQPALQLIRLAFGHLVGSLPTSRDGHRSCVLATGSDLGVEV